MESGQPVPEDAKPPDLPSECLFSYIAFPELMTTRPIGFGVGQIPWTAINDYALRYGLSGDLFEDFVVFVRAIDDAFLAATRPEET